MIRNIQRNIQTSQGALSTTAATTAVITNSGANQNIAAHARGMSDVLLRLRLDVWLHRAWQVDEQGFEVVVEARLDGLLHALLELLIGKPTGGEVITEGGDGPVSLGITDAKLGLLGWSRIHRAVRRWPYPQHVPRGKAQPARIVSSHEPLCGGVSSSARIE